MKKRCEVNITAASEGRRRILSEQTERLCERRGGLKNAVDGRITSLMSLRSEVVRFEEEWL